MSEFFIKIVNMSISASWLVLAVLLLRLFLKKAPKWVDVLLWGIVAVRLICPFSIESVFSLLPSAETISPDIMMDWTPEISTGIGSLDTVVNPIITETFAPKPFASANPLQIWIPVCANLWVLGILLMLVYTAVSYLLLQRRVAACIVLRNNIYQSDCVDSPFVLGIIKPKIYLPLRMDSRNLEHVIAHEQTHIHRKDHWWKPLGFLLLSIYWFNPLMWLGYLLLCRDIELACDEKVIQSMDNDSKADYTQALVDCSVKRHRIAACPLAFGEVGIKERVKSVMNYRKPAFWIVVVAVVACVAVAVCLLTDPVGTGWSRLERITQQVGYTITDQQQKKITLTLSTEDLPDTIYSQEGCEFPEGKLVAYHDDTTKLYLQGARYSNEGTENLYFYFMFSYDLPRDAGAFLYPVSINEENIGSFTAGVADKILRTQTQSFANAVLFRGQDGGERLWFYVSAEALRKIEGNFSFDIQLNQISYQRNGTKQAAHADNKGSVTVAQISSGEEESELKLQVSFSGTDLSQPGQALADKIREEWQRYEQLPELTRQESSHMWGAVYVDTDTWKECENAIGIPVANPLESIRWLKKTGYLGMQSTNPQMYAAHVKATAYATAQSNRRLDRIDMQSGYYRGDTRITLNATVCTGDIILTTGMITRGYATYETEETVTGSGLPVLLVTPQRTNSTGYYQDGWCDQVAYWVKGNVFYKLRVIGNEENPTDMYRTMQDLLKEV